jgi:hypothetical protein
MVGCNPQSPKGFLGKIRIKTYFHGSNMGLVWFGRRRIKRGRKGELGGSFYYISSKLLL